MKKQLFLFILFGSTLLSHRIWAQPLNISVSPQSLCQNSNAMAVVTATQPLAAFYTWSVAAPGSSQAVISNAAPNGSMASITFTACGTHTVYCFAFSSGSIQLNSVTNLVNIACNGAPSPTIATSANNSTLCSGNSVTLTGLGGSTYTWFPGNVASSSIVVSPTSSVCYTLVASNTNSCNSMSTGCLNVLTPTLMVSGNGTVCAGGIATLVASGASNYTWQPGGMTGSSIVVSPSVSTCYSVIGTNASGCTSSALHCIAVQAYPSLLAIGIPSFICAGATATLSAAGASSYTWIPGSIVFSTAVVTPSAPTCYTVYGSSSFGCTTFTTACIGVNPLPVISISGNSVSCSGQSNTLTASGASSYTWIPGNLVGPVVVVSPSVSTCYTVYGTNSFGCTSFTTTCIVVNPLPVVSISGNSVSCSGQTNTITASGANTYAWSNGVAGSSIVVTSTSTICYSVQATGLNGCSIIASHCLSVSPGPSLNIAGNNSVCLGSSLNFTATGANTYTWNTNPVVNTATLSIIPGNSFAYQVAGTGTNGCIGTATLAALVNTACAMVWPGDANRDGVVSNTDVLELGLAANNTGPARTPTSNAWAGQYANAWTGTVSTGWNQAHADCNGDGIVNAADNSAITQNFVLTHGFKNTSNNSANSDISLVPAQLVVYAGSWNRADIMLGDASHTMTQLYGVAFDVDFDQSLVQSDSVRINYTPSFLNAANQNIDFGKTIFANSKYYAATVRVDHSNVSGHGKIGEFWYKLNNVIPANSVMNLSVSNAVKVSANGSMNSLSAGGTSVTVSDSPVGFGESLFSQSEIFVYPNPAAQFVTLQNSSSTFLNYTVLDILGREILTGSFNGLKNLDISALEQGAYLIRFESGGTLVHKKFVVEKH